MSRVSCFVWFLQVIVLASSSLDLGGANLGGSDFKEALLFCEFSVKVFLNWSIFKWFWLVLQEIFCHHMWKNLIPFCFNVTFLQWGDLCGGFFFDVIVAVSRRMGVQFLLAEIWYPCLRFFDCSDSNHSVWRLWQLSLFELEASIFTFLMSTLLWFHWDFEN